VYASRGGEQRDALIATMAVVDASVHLPVGDRVLCFAGLGPGLLYNGEDFGLGVKARSGVDVLIGRSGVFRPGLFYTWMSTPLVDLSGVATSSRHQFGVEIAYGAMF